MANSENSVESFSRIIGNEDADAVYQMRKVQAFLETIRKLIRRSAWPKLTNILNRTHPADIAFVLQHLEPDERWQLFQPIQELKAKAAVLSYLDHNALPEFMERIPTPQLVEILSQLEKDDAADLLGQLPPEQADEILQRMQDESSKQVEKLMLYNDDTAGGIMDPDFFALDEDITAKQAIAALQDAEDKEMVFYIYAIDDAGRLTGVLSLRQLLIHPPDAPLKKIMRENVVSVRPEMDQEEVARIVSRYDILAVPVVDDQHKLIGIVTVDDVIDVIREEATEDILKMVGAGDDVLMASSTFTSARKRIPWLGASWLGGIVAMYAIGAFKDVISSVVALVGFMPVITGMGGNIGTQSSTLVVRGLSTGKLGLGKFGKVWRKELTVALIIGVTYGIALGVVAQILYSDAGNIGIVVGVSICLAMMIASTIGTLLPMLFQRLSIDPAIATGPFVTTGTDIFAVVIYFAIAKMVFGL